MNKPNSQFIVSIETECLTAVPGDPEATSQAIAGFLERFAQQAPSLNGTAGVFNGYAKVYCDCGHIEIAIVECDSPYTTALIFERLQILVARAVAELAAGGIELVLANNNHSGLLRDDANVWGTHENYLTDRHPSTFSEQILPFLVTRIYGGSGGVHHPSGDFLASVRSNCMTTASGGGTTERRAIHSLARDEHHMGSSPQRFRYHLILGDGHRSLFNLALQLGATALAVKAVMFDTQLQEQIASLRNEFSQDWITTLREVNVLSRRGQPLKIHPLVVRTQRVYLEAAVRVAAAMEAPPEWVHRLLTDWRRTLLAYESCDRTWLARHLDTFAKYDFYSAVLADMGCNWSELPRRQQLFRELALLNQSYHEFSHVGSVFSQLEAAGMLDHRVGPRIEPGQEADPYIPEVATRAKPRAKFIRDHRNRPEFEIDWSCIRDKRQPRFVRLDDPFAQELGQWVPIPRTRCPAGRSSSEGPLLDEVLRLYDLGRYDEALLLLIRAELMPDLQSTESISEVLRHRAWLRARCGFVDGQRLLGLVYREPPTSLSGITDYCCVHRFTGLCPDLNAMQPWIDSGQALLRSSSTADADVEQAAVFREHAAVGLARHGRFEDALALLRPALAEPARQRISARLQAQLLATLGETYRRMGQVAQARGVLEQAMHAQLEHGHLGYLSYCTWLSLAKSAERPADSIRWLQQAKAIQQRNRDRVGLVTTMLLEARLADNDALVEENKTQVLTIRNELPALRGCSVLGRILDHWDAWIAPDPLDGGREDFWGL